MYCKCPNCGDIMLCNISYSCGTPVVKWRCKCGYDSGEQVYTVGDRTEEKKRKQYLYPSSQSGWNEMTLDEAICHAEKMAKRNERLCKINMKHGGSVYMDESRRNARCAAEHHQLVEWLKELKILRAEKTMEDNKFMNEFVICGFSGIGKTTAGLMHKRILDLESSPYSHLSKNGIVYGRNPDFPSNYINALVKSIDEDVATYYLMSCHAEVRKELKERGIGYIIVMPTIEQKNEYLKRWLKRGSPMKFIKAMNENWIDMIKSCEEDDCPKIYLEKDEYISGLIRS